MEEVYRGGLVAARDEDGERCPQDGLRIEERAHVPSALDPLRHGASRDRGGHPLERSGRGFVRAGEERGRAPDAPEVFPCGVARSCPGPERQDELLGVRLVEVLAQPLGERPLLGLDGARERGRPALLEEVDQLGRVVHLAGVVRDTADRDQGGDAVAMRGGEPVADRRAHGVPDEPERPGSDGVGRRDDVGHVRARDMSLDARDTAAPAAAAVVEQDEAEPREALGVPGAVPHRTVTSAAGVEDDREPGALLAVVDPRSVALDERHGDILAAWASPCSSCRATSPRSRSTRS
jgi:hypothetical protein